MTTNRRAKRDRILDELRDLKDSGDPETAHIDADDMLLELIDDPEITAAYTAIGKWYA